MATRDMIVSPLDVADHYAEEEAQPVEKSLVPAIRPTLDVVSFDAETFKANLAKVQMWTSYTGPVPESLDGYINLPLEIKGMIVQDLKSIDEDTGEVRMWQEVRFKTTDEKIVSGSGKAVRQFAELLLSQLGQGDWPISIKILVKRRQLASTTKDGKPKFMPVFQVIG